jgi:tape measure domain-containing protein
MAGAALAWGGATAVATETATVKFGTLLQDMDQGKALIKEITTFSAATPFSNEELRESAGLLLAAQVPADQITSRLQMLGDIASGTSQPIGDLSKVFQKVASTGKLGLGEINQLAERGVPIYTALQDTLGVSRSEMLKMVSDGKLGFADMDAALQSLTASGGTFAGGMATQSQTMAGLFSTLKDNVAIALESVVSILMPFAKRVVETAISITQGFVAGFQKIQPVLQMWFEASAALFQLLSDAASVVFSGIASLAALAFGSMGSNGGGILQGLMEGFLIFFATAKFAFENIGLTWQIVSTGVNLMAVQMFNGMVHWLTVALPAYMSWFGENWKNLFTDMGVATLTIFENMFKNIKSIMNAIWAFISSAGMSSIEVAWTPLLDGFIATTKKLPDIPTRQIGAMEKALMAESDALSTKFAKGLESGIADAMKMLEPEKEIELKGGTGIDTTMGDEDEDKKQKSRTSFVVEAIDKNSEAGLKAMLGAKDDQTPQKQLTALQKIAKNTTPKQGMALEIQGAVG